MREKARSRRGWAIKDPSGWIHTGHIRTTARQSWIEFLDLPPSKYSNGVIKDEIKNSKRDGYSAVRVRVVEE